ncbi:MAG: glycosyl hydrolase [Candidatus Staskawiczbacteria bacterium]|nr:glycosyl hydrolase [Candidatus Staskawiczbacteria bacterium]
MSNIYKVIVALLVVVGMAGAVIFLNQTRVTENKMFSGKKFWGAYTGNTTVSFLDFQNQVGKKADIQAVFIGWYEKFPINLALPLKQNNQTLVIFWEQYGVTLDEIMSGSTDEYIRQFANDAQAYGASVILAPLHEMNGDWSPWSGVTGENTPEKVVLTWRHIHDLFSKKNSNIKWAFVVNNESSPDTEENKIQNYYPEDEYVDYVGVDGFNFGEPWQSYADIFSEPLKQLKAYNKPVYIFSMASAQGPEKAVWITDALLKIKNDPQIEGFIWFNVNKEKNWLVSSDAFSLEAFKKSLE